MFLPQGGVYRTSIRIEVLLPGAPTLFHRRLDDAFIQANSMLGTDVILHRTFIGEAETARMAERIHTAASSRKGLIVYAPDVPEVLGAFVTPENRELYAQLPALTAVP